MARCRFAGASPEKRTLRHRPEAPGLAVSHQGRTGLHGQRDRHVQDDAVFFGPVAVDGTPKDVTYGPQYLSLADRSPGSDFRVPAPLILRRQVDGIADLALFPVRRFCQGRQQLQMGQQCPDVPLVGIHFGPGPDAVAAPFDEQGRHAAQSGGVIGPCGGRREDAHVHIQDLRSLAVTRRDPGVEIRGTVADDAAMIRLRDMARGLHIPVYMEVAVQEDILRAVRSSLGIRGFHPDVVLWENKGNPRLQIRAYMKDELLETAAFTALKAEVRGLPAVDRHIVYEKDLAPVLDAALQREGLGNVRVIYLPGRVDFSGDFRPEDTKKLDVIRQDASELFGVRLHGTSSASGALAAAERSLTPSRDGEPAGAAPARPSGNGGGDPLGGLRVTGVTMSPMRFVTTADGRRLFEGAVLPSGWTLESIDTKVLVLRNGSQVVSHRLRGK